MGYIVDDEDEYMDLDPVCQIRRIECGEYRPLTHTLDRRSVLERRSGGCCLYYYSLLAREVVCPLESIQCVIERIEVLDF